jgi:hypothetical protein
MHEENDGVRALARSKKEDGIEACSVAKDVGSFGGSGEFFVRGRIGGNGRRGLLSNGNRSE